MSQDRLTALRLLSYYWMAVIVSPPNTSAFNVAYKDPSLQSSAFYQGGRKFGGYRIVPRACKDAETSFKNHVVPAEGSGSGRGGGGVCMFNYECTQLGGTVVGSCVDVFLFGACCRLPPGTKLPNVVEESVGGGGSNSIGGGGGGSASQQQRPYGGVSGANQQQQRPYGGDLMSFQPMADTILLHRNGSAVQNAYGPDDMSADLLANFTAAALAQHNGGGITDVLVQRFTDRPDGTLQPFANKITSKIDFGPGTKQTSPVSKSTDSVPNFRKTTPSIAQSAVQATTSKQGVHRPHDDDYDNMVLIPTLTVHDPNRASLENNTSIHHILSILNQPMVQHTSSAADPMTVAESTFQQYQTTASPAALYTWGSIEGDSKSPGYGASFPSTKPTPSTSYHHQHQPQQHYDRPQTTNNYYGGGGGTTSTSTHHLPGPHFHVTTGRPAEPVAPTVIVLSSVNDSKNPNKYSTSVYTTSSSARPPPSSHVKPSQSIVVTGKPSVSAQYTTTATYHQHHHQQQQHTTFVPVGSTTTSVQSDNYYQTSAAAVHTSAKPLVSSSGKPPLSSSTYGKPPATLSSTVHHHAADHNNNVFTTVITSVNHNNHNHNKYQPTTATASTYSTAKPVLNNDAVAVISSSTSGGGYRPHVSVTDDDYPSPPVVTPPSQVFITATDVHHHHTPSYPSAADVHHQHTPSYPSAADVHHQHTPSYSSAADVQHYHTPSYADETSFNSTDTFAFPPVRDPNVNLTASQQEKPVVIAAGEGSGAGGVASGPYGDYEADTDPNPQLTADDNLDDKVHLFVEKVVQSLQGNFEDLEKVLLSGDPSTANVTVGYDSPQDSYPTTGWPNKKPTTTSTTTKKPPKTSNKPSKPPKVTTSTYKPTPITFPLDAAPYLELTSTARPTKIPTLLTPVQLFQPTTYTTDHNKRPKPTKVPSTTVVLDTLHVEHDHTTAEPDFRKVCGVRPLVRKNGRIVGGTGSTFGEWPWQVLVREATWLGLFTKNKCGGVLITQKHVITAAHCQPGFLANLVAVFGEYDISGEVESKRSISKNVKRVIVHRQYDAATFENDIALLELESPISYDQHIVPICMPDDDDDFTGRMAVVTGWGRLKYGGGVPSILQEVQVPIIENQVCQDMFETAGHTKTILSSFLCAGYANGQRDSCEGDSGGPLMIEKDNGRWTLIGTVSHGIKCASPYLPGVYMRTTYYKPWLQTITGVQR